MLDFSTIPRYDVSNQHSEHPFRENLGVSRRRPLNTFKRKALCAAVLAGLGALGTTGTASASPVPTALVIYPYYTVSITEKSGHYPVPAIAVAGKEGKHSAEVLDFNLYLSPHDVWTGAHVRTVPTTGTA